MFGRSPVPLTSVPLRRQTDSAARWTLSFVRPYRRGVAALAGLSLAEIALRALAPWPLKAIVDFLTRGIAPAGVSAAFRAHPSGMLVAIVVAGLLLQAA